MRFTTKRRAQLALAGLVATLGIGIPAASAQAAGINGTVTAEDTGQPLAGACVSAWTEDSFIEAACTDDAGSYQLGTLTDGVDYFIQVDRVGNYLGEWAFDQRTLETADPVTAPATVNFALTPGVAIDGVVTDEGTGDPVPDTCITAYDPSFNFANATCTDQDGRYVLDGLESGVDYRLEVLPPGSDLVGEWAFHKTSFEDADPVTAPATADIPLRHGDRIDGTVTGDDTGEPIEGICVRAFFAEDGGFADIDCTNAEGRYALGVAPGFEYRIEADGNENYAGEWAFDKTSEEDADLVTPPSVVDFGLVRLGQFTGTLTLPDGSPAAFASVSLWAAEAEGDFIDSVTTDEAGQWSIGIRPGNYKINAALFPFTIWAFDAPDEASADVLALASGDVVTVDLQFPPLGRVRGRVTEAGTGDPIAGICVRLFAPDGGNPADDSCTSADGRYAVDVPAGSYTVRFRSGDGKWVSEWHQNALREADADPVAVGAGATVRVNAGLKRAGKITGRLVDPVTDAPLPNLCVTPVDPATLQPIESGLGGCADPEGRYTISGLPAGKVLLRTPGDHNLRPEAWAPGVPTADTAKKYVIVSAETTHAGRFKVPVGGILSGRVTNQAGEPLAGIEITPRGGFDRSGELRTATTNANGEYELSGLSLAPFVPGAWDPTGTYGWQWSGGAADRADATPVVLQSGQASTLDFVLAPAAELVITVVDGNGVPLPVDDLELSVLARVGQLEIGSGFMFGGQSTVTVRGLPGAPVLLKIFGAEVWYDQATSEATATLINLTAGETTQVNFTLPAG